MKSCSPGARPERRAAGQLRSRQPVAAAAVAAAAAAAYVRRDARGAACRLNTAIDAALLPDAVDSHHAHEFSFSSEDEAGDGHHGHHGRYSRHGTRHWHHGGSGGGGGGGGPSGSGGVNSSGGSGAVAASSGATSPASSAGEGGAQPAGARAVSQELPPADGLPVKHRPITPPRPKGGHGTPPPRVTFKEGDGTAPPRPARAGASFASSTPAKPPGAGPACRLRRSRGAADPRRHTQGLRGGG